MIRRALITLMVFLLIGAGVFGAGALAEPSSAVLPIDENSPCPAAGCSSGECHGFDDVPEPDGVHEMTCPEVSCADAECHAWDSLTGRYHQASDASLNVWVLAPVVLVVALMLVVSALSKSGRGRPSDAAFGGKTGDERKDGADEER